MKTLRKAIFGPSLVALALCGLIFGAAKLQAQESERVVTPETPVFGESPRAKVQTEPAPEPEPEPPINPAPPATPNNSAFRVSAGLSHPNYEAGQPAQFFLSVENVSTEAVTLNYTSGQKFDFEAYHLDRDGQPAAKPFWKWSNGRMFAMALSSKTLNPGERENFKAQMDSAPRGKFQIRPRSTANGGIEAAPFELLVQ